MCCPVGGAMREGWLRLSAKKFKPQIFFWWVCVSKFQCTQGEKKSMSYSPGQGFSSLGQEHHDIDLSYTPIGQVQNVRNYTQTLNVNPLILKSISKSR